MRRPHITNNHIKAFFSVCLILFVQPLSQAQQRPQVRLFDDPRVVTWSKGFLAGNREQVLQAVEQDLRSASPHPFAPPVWVNTQSYLGRLKQVWQEMQDPSLRRALGILPDVFLLYSDGQYKELLSRFPASRVSEIRDLWALHYLFFSATEQCRYEDALAYVMQMTRLRSDYFQVGWMITRDLMMNERIRPKIAALVSPKGEFARTMLGRFLQNELKHLPSGNVDEDYLTQLTAWLKERPNDARAIRAKGFAL